MYIRRPRSGRNLRRSHARTTRVDRLHHRCQRRRRVDTGGGRGLGRVGDGEDDGGEYFGARDGQRGGSG